MKDHLQKSKSPVTVDTPDTPQEASPKSMPKSVSNSSNKNTFYNLI